jgi:alkanesulfonate monooxygenase SsuD/methylene tetrahydromethanopterin reductase-like flavin-dependent oxidoreductase (luciferase family)
VQNPQSDFQNEAKIFNVFRARPIRPGVSTTYTEPYNLARQFCSPNHLGRDRIGRNIVTPCSPQARSNYGGVGQVNRGDHYELAEEYIAKVKGLWDSWAEGFVLDDREGGRYADRAGAADQSFRRA